MSPKIAVLLVAMLVITACAAPAAATTAAWTPEESDYLSALLEPVDEMTRQMYGLPPDGKKLGREEIRSQLSHLPDAPASLAAIDYYRSQVVYACSEEQFARVVDGCRLSNDALRLELARLYAARGSYPPTPIP